VEAVKFLWKRKHFEEKSWKRKQTRKRLTLYVAGSGSKKYSIASTSLIESISYEMMRPYPVPCGVIWNTTNLQKLIMKTAFT